jgi:hypothetical protein
MNYRIKLFLNYIDAEPWSNKRVLSGKP